MKLVVGLGNPGRRYEGTRHNIGFDVLDLVARRHGVRMAPWRDLAEVGEWRRPEGKVLLVTPVTFMNLSGEAVSALVGFYKIDLNDVLVVCDDVNLPVGKLRMRLSGSAGGNNGLRSVAASLGTEEYARLRIGVGRGDTARDLADHVLSRFAPEEMPGMQDAVTRAADAIEQWIVDGTARVMNAVNG
jgi:peptidyl-tRNA hydrolase, PTH1 family